mgnify:CR=1 FL=1
MKKTLAMLLALAMSLSLLTGCGSKKDDAPAADNSDAAAGETTGEAKPGEGMKIALVCDKVGTQVFLTQMVEALNEAADKYGFEATVAECADSAAFEDNIRALVAEEYDLIIGGGWQSGDAVNKVATEYPDAAHYALIDSEVEAENVKCISYREQEGAYLIGALAALTTDGESHKYGAVHVNEGPGSWKWRYGYMEGVKSIDPDAEFVFNYTGSYSDPAKAKELAIQQYEQGCVFINSAAAGGDSGTFEAAKEKGFYAIGVDSDQKYIDPEVIICSMKKEVGSSIYDAVKSYLAGDSRFGTTWTADMATGYVGIGYGDSGMAQQVPDEVKAAVEELAAKIASGEIVVETTRA